MALIELKGVCKSYRQGGVFRSRRVHRVLESVDLAIRPGECLGLLGRSGSGKSTLGRLVLGLERPEAGEAMYEGVSIHNLNGEAYRTFRRNVQVVFQNSLGSVNPRFTAADIIAEPIRNFEVHSKDALREIVGNLMEQVGLSVADAYKYPHQFSGGELQRICIARAIALKPRLIVLDEAVSSLDMLNQAKIVELLLDLQQHMGTAYVFISHDIRVLMKMADRIVVLSDGKIVDEIDPERSEETVRHPVFSELIESVLPPMPPCAEW
ncbi:nickel import ATP-binding protein NikE [Desulfatiferula olefinivorans]